MNTQPVKSAEAENATRPSACLAFAWPDGDQQQRCLLFSPGGVLFDDSVWSRWLLQLLARMGLHTHPQAFIELWRRDYFEDVCFSRREHWEALKAMLVASGLSQGQADEVCAAARPRWRQLQSGLHAFPQVASTLSALSAAGVSLGVAACCPLSAEQVKQQLERMDLAHWFDFVLTSHDLGCESSLGMLYQRAAALWQGGDRLAIKFVSSRASEAHAARQAGYEVIVNYATADDSSGQFERFSHLLALVPPEKMRVLAS
jgi:beta-phosphoglucomutase-like phosphatase (HAD superfamily)